VPALSFTGSYSRYESLPVRVAYLGLFCWGAAASPASRWVVPAFILGCCVAAFEAVIEWGTGSLPRPDGNLGQPNLLGVLLAMAIVLSVIRARRDPRWVPAVGLLGAGILACTSRSGWLATLIGVVVAVVFAVPARHLRRAALVGAGVVGLALLLVVASPLRTLNSDTGGARVGVWGDALRMATARPLTGWGEDTMGLHFGHFQTKDWEPGHSFDRAHDQPIDLFVAQGLLGLAASGLFFGIFWWGLWRRRGEPRQPNQSWRWPASSSALASSAPTIRRESSCGRSAIFSTIRSRSSCVHWDAWYGSRQEHRMSRKPLPWKSRSAVVSP